MSLYPFAAATLARPIPVLPLVGSIITESALSFPVFSASSIIAFAILSLTEPAGLKYSSFTSFLFQNSVPQEVVFYQRGQVLIYK